MGERVRITDVAPRDGLQSEPRPIPAAEKARLIEAIGRTGVDEIEVSSFVSPKWIPQLGDAAEVFAELAQRGARRAGVVYSALVPNLRGMEEVARLNAEAQVVDKIAVFTAATETFSKRNTNATIAETLQRFAPVAEMARSMPGGAIAVRGYVSCAVACPYEGPVDPGRVASVAGRLVELGVGEIDLGDTIGAGTPETIVAVIERVRGLIGPGVGLTIHLHDTFGRAAECVKAALGAGVRSFDAASGGLGGCPFASTPHRRAPGNISLARLVEAVEGEGYTTGVDHAAMHEAARVAEELLAEGARP